VGGSQLSSVQTLLSLQAIEGSMWTQPDAGLHESGVQRLLSSQFNVPEPV
jgi:hypothetical protein